MKSIHDLGIILNVRPLQETSKQITVWCKNYGKIICIAKGANKILSRKAGSLELLNYGKLLLHQTNSWALLLEIETLDDFEDIKKNLTDLSDIFYLLDICSRFLPEEEPTAYLWQVFLDTLKLIRKFPQQHDLLISGFELKLLANLGFSPALDACLYCQEMLKQGEERIAATGSQAGYLCYKHFGSSNFQRILVADNVLKVQRYLLQESVSTLIKLNIDKTLQERIRSIHKTWIEGILETRLKSNEFKETVKLQKHERNQGRN